MSVNFRVRRHADFDVEKHVPATAVVITLVRVSIFACAAKATCKRTARFRGRVSYDRPTPARRRLSAARPHGFRETKRPRKKTRPYAHPERQEPVTRGAFRSDPVPIVLGGERAKIEIENGPFWGRAPFGQGWRGCDDDIIVSIRPNGWGKKLGEKMTFAFFTCLVVFRHRRYCFNRPVSFCSFVVRGSPPLPPHHPRYVSVPPTTIVRKHTLRAYPVYGSMGDTGVFFL